MLAQTTGKSGIAEMFSILYAKLGNFVFERSGGAAYEIHDGWAAAFVGKFMETSANLNF